MNLDQKAQEIALALIKISVYARRTEFRSRLEKLAFDLLDQAYGRDFDRLAKTIAVLNGLVNFGKAIYEIEPVNARILLSEFGNLNSAIAQFAESELPNSKATLDIAKLFSKEQTLFDEHLSVSNDSAKATRDNSQKDLSVSVGNEREIKPINNPKRRALRKSSSEAKKSNNEDNPAIRQSAIAEKIRQFGNKEVKLKDVIAEFPDVSERTLRYDLERLCNQGILERVGQSGPSTYYKLREI